jgi:hypothetical protein
VLSTPPLINVSSDLAKTWRAWLRVIYASSY